MTTGARGRPTGIVRRADHAFGRLMQRFFAGGWGARLTYAIGLEGRISAETHVFTVARTPGRDTPLRIAFASDLHAGATTHPDLLTNACRALADMRADVLLLGGDFVAFDARDIDPLVPLLRSIPAPLGKFAVLGNHDLVGGEQYVVSALEAAGVEVLTNRNARLPAPHDDIWICGLDDPTFGAPDAAPAFDGAEGTRLVLMHSPDGLLSMGDRGFAVAFCGHTHGGQVALPLGRAVVVPHGRLSRRFSRGTFSLRHGGALLVSRGVGCTTIPLRIFSGPQVHACVVLAGGAVTQSSTADEPLPSAR